MTSAEGIRLAVGGILMLGGLFVFVTAVIGNFRFPDAATRMHAAALGDTLGILLLSGSGLHKGPAGVRADPAWVQLCHGGDLADS